MLKKILGNKKLLADIILVAALLLISLSVFIVITLTREEGSVVRVSVDGMVVGEYSLNDDAEYSLNGGTNILVIEGGEAYLRYSNCPDKTCVYGNTVYGNKISMSGERIDCLPNHVKIEIIGAEEEIL